MVRSATLVDIESITVGTSRRTLRPDTVEQLAASIRAVGLLNPITVTDIGELVAGLHRLEACKRLGWTQIEARTIAAVDAELAEIDENLIRAELTALERGEHMARRKALYEERHPETKAGAVRAAGMNRALGNDVGETVSPTFTEATAAKIGATPRSVQQDVQIGALPEPVREAIRDTPVADRKVDLLNLSRMAPKAQEEVAALIQEGAPTVAAAVQVVGKALTAEERTRIFREERDKRRQVVQQRKAAKNEELAERASVAGPALEGVDLRNCDVAEVLNDHTIGYAAELIHADPPWSYDRNDRNGAAEKAYEVLRLDGIVEHVDRAYDLALDNARLLLWCTFPKLLEWFEASKNMRWRYVTGGAWTKEGIGIGDHWRGDAEILLMYVKGSPTKPLGVLSNAHHSARLAHSEKPEAWLQQIVEQLTAPRALVVDLYAGMAPLARACHRAGRRYVGAEIDAERHAQALGKLR